MALAYNVCKISMRMDHLLLQELCMYVSPLRTAFKITFISVYATGYANQIQAAIGVEAKLFLYVSMVI